jgi:hypothetical protein
MPLPRCDANWKEMRAKSMLMFEHQNGLWNVTPYIQDNSLACHKCRNRKMKINFLKYPNECGNASLAEKPYEKFMRVSHQCFRSSYNFSV